MLFSYSNNGRFLSSLTLQMSMWQSHINDYTCLKIYRQIKQVCIYTHTYIYTILIKGVFLHLIMVAMTDLLTLSHYFKEIMNAA